eukprot:TRINITY_DN770_c0_g1_i1.p1 TRINITY_DN770_c0_g1~~TRINITY_DN770_c0_g1_i1.p1  ORF type:complete len:114 (-),score=0.37 TRINITY_DN770_c0_g1_i1:174-479(-)
MDETEESAFMVEGEVEPIVKSVIDLYLKDKMFDEKQLPHWINSICEDVVKQLSDLKKPFKYVGKSDFFSSCALFFHSFLFYNAKEWSGSSCNKFLSLGCSK